MPWFRCTSDNCNNEWFIDAPYSFCQVCSHIGYEARPYTLVEYNGKDDTLKAGGSQMGFDEYKEWWERFPRSNRLLKPDMEVLLDEWLKSKQKVFKWAKNHITSELQYLSTWKLR